MSSRLHRAPGHPYYIVAPGYRETSSGVCVLHYLCHALNLEGRDAFIVGDVAVNPQLKTPLLTEEIKQRHIEQHRVPIAVYPEVAVGNPLGAAVVVRYLLNREGLIAGRSMKAQEDDLYYHYAPDFAPDSRPANLLTLPIIDSELFRERGQAERTISYLYLNRFPRDRVDFSRLPEDIEVLSVAEPKSLSELAELFQSAAVLYSYELSATCTQAMLCGCPVVYLRDGGVEELPFKSYIGESGAAMIDEVGGLERARATVADVYPRWLGMEDEFWEQLADFQVCTQARAEERAADVGKRELLAWLAERVPTEAQHRLIAERLAANRELTFCVLVVDSEGDNERLVQTVKSLGMERNLYASVRILALTTAEVPKTPTDAKLRFLRLNPDQPLQSIDRALREVEVDWFMLVDVGSEFTPSGLLVAALDLLAAPGCRAVYGDEVARQQGGDMGAMLRPDLNLDLLLSLPSGMARHWLFNRQVWLDMGGFRQEAGQAFELDYILRLIESAGFDGLGHISEPLLIGEAQPLRDCPDEREAIQRHLRARGFPQGRVDSRLPGRYELDYGVSAGARVSILILLQGNGLGRVQRCMETILEKTSYPFYEVLLLVQDNSDPTLQTWLKGVEQLGTEAIRVLRFAADLSAPQVRNLAAEQASGEFLLWLDEGAAVFEADWLQQMLNHASRQEVAAVGAKLLAADRTVSHAGFILGLNGPVGKAFTGQPLEAPGYLQRLQVDQNYTAVSGKCLLLRRSLFMEVGGFDETPVLQRWADVDLCLRLHRAGYLNVWTPRVQLLLNEDTETPASIEEEDALYARWLPLLARDPFYNPNFSLASAGSFTLSPSKLNWRPLSSWKPVPTILAHAADRQGCGNYRVIQPLDALNREGQAEGLLSWSLLLVAELERYKPDSIVLQRQVGDVQLEHIRRMKAFSSAFKVFELDDYLPNLPIKSMHRAHMPKDILRSIRRGLSYVDRFVVSTEPLAEAFSGLHGDIQVVRNSLDPRWWRGLSSQRNCSRKPRVGWAGGVSHTGDLEMIADVVKELASEVEWVFFGMCPDKLRPYIHEYHLGVPIGEYPAALASLNLDLALAPVEQNLFNECKSNLRLLEYGACGFPVVCSDVRCYQGDDLPVTRVKNRFRDWVEAIRMHLSDLDETARQGNRLREVVQKDWMLEGDNLQRWREVWLPG